MAWLSIDKYGTENISQFKPERYIGCWLADAIINIPNGTIEKLIGRELTWKDEPIELK